VQEPEVFPAKGRLLLATNTGHDFVVSQVAAGTYLQDIAVGVLTGDGRADVAGFSLQFKTDFGPTPVTVFEQRPGGGFTARRYGIANSAFPAAVSVGDVTGDGRQDLIFAEGVGTSLRVLAQTATGRLDSPRAYWITDNPDAIQAVDFDGDGRADVVGAFDGGPGDVVGPSVGGPLPMGSLVGLLRQDESGGLYPEAGFPIPSDGASLWPTGLAVGDVNGDGKPDIVIAELNEGVVVFYQDTATLVPPRTDILDGPPEVTEDPKVTLSFTGDRPHVSFQYALNSWQWQPCASPVVYANPCCGSNVFHVRAVAPGGVTEATPAEWSWITKRAAP
jgi:hypothetical protein